MDIKLSKAMAKQRDILVEGKYVYDQYHNKARRKF